MLSKHFHYLAIVFLFTIALKGFSQEYNAEVICNKTSIEIDKNKISKKYQVEIKILNKEGERYCNVNIPYSGITKISQINASITDCNGNEIKRLRSSDIKSHSEFASFSFYEDDMVNEFTLVHNVYPYILKFSFTEQSKSFISIEDWQPYVFKDIPTQQAILQLKTDKDYSCHIKVLNNVKNSKAETAKEINYEWSCSYIPPKKEILSYFDYNKVNRVRIMPDVFNFEKQGSFRTWSSFGEWTSKLLEGKMDLTTEQKDKIRNYVSDITDLKEKIKKLYYQLQDETHYINISIKTDGLNPHPASYVATNKYGDCKALSNYFKAVLDAIGIKSYYTLIEADERNIPIDTLFPSPSFNHVILFVPLQTDTIWLDCTSKLPIGYVGTSIQNRWAFVVDDINSHFVKTPAMQPKNTTVISKMNISLSEIEKAKIECNTNYYGENFENLFYCSKYLKSNDVDRFVKERLLNELDLINYQIIPQNKDAQFIALQYKASSQKFIKKYGDDLIVYLIPFKLHRFEKPKDRTFDVAIDYPINQLDTICIISPDNLQWSNNIENTEINNRFGRYSVSCKKVNNVIQVVKQMTIYQNTINMADYPLFYSFIQQITDKEKKNNLLFTKSKLS